MCKDNNLYVKTIKKSNFFIAFNGNLIFNEELGI